MRTTVVALVSTIGSTLLANRVQEIGERIPFVLLSMWAGSATIAALIFSTGLGPRSSASAQVTVVDSRLWAYKMRLIGVSLLPLAFGAFVGDPALWI